MKLSRMKLQRFRQRKTINKRSINLRKSASKVTFLIPKMISPRKNWIPCRVAFSTQKKTKKMPLSKS